MAITNEDSEDSLLSLVLLLLPLLHPAVIESESAAVINSAMIFFVIPPFLYFPSKPTEVFVLNRLKIYLIYLNT